jgi:hypothetical protein
MPSLDPAPPPRRLGRLLAEPLLHFLLGGVALFALHALVAPPRRIEVDAALAARLRADQARRGGSAPADALIERHVDQEVLYREALLRGLDRNDVIVRRRLVQKMQFLLEAEARPGVPDDAPLEAWRAAHAERFARPARARFAHVFVARDRHPDDLAAAAAALKARLDRGEDPERLGDAFPRGARLGPLAAPELDAMFGPGFGAEVLALPEGAWSPPIASSYGLHLVRVEAHTPARAAGLDEVRAEVTEGWTGEARERLARAALVELRKRYDVHVAGGVR